MRITSSVTAVSWIPSEAVTGAFKLPFTMGMAHYDAPPPDAIESVEVLRQMVHADKFRFANCLSAWIEVEGGQIVQHGFEGEGIVCTTTLQLVVGSLTFAPTVFPALRPEPERLPDGGVRFVQTCGGRTGVPAPRPVSRRPYFQLAAPTAWTTLELDLHADGQSQSRLIGSSPFPRHWVYDATGQLFQKSSYIDFRSWNDAHFGDNTPWGNADSPALVHAVESALERQLSSAIMRDGHRPQIRRLPAGANLCRQGEPGTELYLLIDGVLEVVVGDQKVAEIGPGAVLGERAWLEGGSRTSTLHALTPCVVAVAAADKIDTARLQELASIHRREDEAQ
jgi:Cyclic nucleotide-binding domain